MIDLSNELAIGIDIGGTNTKYGIVNHRGEILEQGDLRTDAYPKVEEYVDALHKTLKPIIKENSEEKTIKGIGIGAPNGNPFSGTIEYAPNLRWKGVIPLCDLVTAKFKMPSIINNDAKAAAIGEMTYGAARGMKDFIMITLGTGVGSGIVANGKLIYGHDGFAGELGHTIVIPDGRLHEGTDKKGSLESYASATGVRLTTLELLEKTDTPSILRRWQSEELDSKKVYEAAITGDELA